MSRLAIGGDKGDNSIHPCLFILLLIVMLSLVGLGHLICKLFVDLLVCYDVLLCMCWLFVSNMVTMIR